MTWVHTACLRYTCQSDDNLIHSDRFKLFSDFPNFLPDISQTKRSISQSYIYIYSNYMNFSGCRNPIISKELNTSIGWMFIMLRPVEFQDHWPLEHAVIKVIFRRVIGDNIWGASGGISNHLSRGFYLYLVKILEIYEEPMVHTGHGVSAYTAGAVTL